MMDQSSSPLKLNSLLGKLESKIMEETITPTVKQPKINTPIAIIIAGLLVAGGLYYGLQGGSVKTTFGTQSGSQVNIVTPFPQGGTANQPTTNTPNTIKVSVDDDPVLGDPDAPVTMIEFSDFECPFCKRSFEQILPSLKQDYIETGKVKFVYRDLPLPFHNPLATQEALAANCARDQGGDETYFKYHDEIFNRTKSNGRGLTTDGLYTIANDLKLKEKTFKSCLDSEKYKDEVTKDLQEANAAGATGTPTFFIGKSTPDGIIDGEIIIGAVPYTSIKPVIEKYLEE